MAKSSYQNIIESKPIPQKSTAGQASTKQDEDFKNLSYSLSDIDENDLKQEMLDEVDSDLEYQTTFNNFNQWSDEQKLYALSQKTQELYKKANEFDSKILALNKQYNFLDSAIEKELGNVVPRRQK